MLLQDASYMDMYEQLCTHGKENVTLGVPCVSAIDR